ncbi:MAG: hypothetical protein JWR12_3082 [Mucilaginibacter sp.]|nr:hypothetical protein [Mucilaginibacter sp.]
MQKEEIFKELDSLEYRSEFNRIVSMRESMIDCFLFCFMNANRDQESAKKNFTLRLLEDLIQSVTSMEYLAKEGFMNACKRELRYLLELSLKACYIVNIADGGNFEHQIKNFEKILNSSNINPINTLSITYLSTHQASEFKADVKRLYGLLCKYVHASTHQIQEKVLQIENGRSLGHEGTAALQELNSLVERTYSTVIIFLFNSVPPFVVGDFLVEDDGSINKWYFNQSRYVTIIDAYFDYKFERQNKLQKLADERVTSIRF